MAQRKTVDPPCCIPGCDEPLPPNCIEGECCYSCEENACYNHPACRCEAVEANARKDQDDGET